MFQVLYSARKKHQLEIFQPLSLSRVVLSWVFFRNDLPVEETGQVYAPSLPFLSVSGFVRNYKILFLNKNGKDEKDIYERGGIFVHAFLYCSGNLLFSLLFHVYKPFVRFTRFGQQSNRSKTFRYSSSCSQGLHNRQVRRRAGAWFYRYKTHEIHLFKFKSCGYQGKRNKRL